MESTKKYVPRGQFNTSFMTKLTCYENIMKYAGNPKSNLDIQVRGDSINLYYNGGSLLKLTGKETVNFSEYYFYLPSKDDLRSSDIQKLCKKNFLDENVRKGSAFLKSKSENEMKELHKKAISTREGLKKKRDEVVYRLKNSPNASITKSILEEMKGIMDDWKKNLVENGWRVECKNERTVQHFISQFNKRFDDDTDYIVLDIEYALPAESDYFNKKELNRNKHPRLDIIALDRNGQIYVMELKYGMKSVDNESGAKKHLRDFNQTVGHPDYWRSFTEDIQILVNYKKNCGFIQTDVKLDTTQQPCFAFIMKEENESDKKNFKHHLEKENMSDVITFVLPKDTGNDPEENLHKLSKKNIL